MEALQKKTWLIAIWVHYHTVEKPCFFFIIFSFTVNPGLLKKNLSDFFFQKYLAVDLLYWQVIR